MKMEKNDEFIPNKEPYNKSKILWKKILDVDHPENISMGFIDFGIKWLISSALQIFFNNVLKMEFNQIDDKIVVELSEY